MYQISDRSVTLIRKGIQSTKFDPNKQTRQAKQNLLKRKQIHQNTRTSSTSCFVPLTLKTFLFDPHLRDNCWGINYLIITFIGQCIAGASMHAPAGDVQGLAECNLKCNIHIRCIYRCLPTFATRCSFCKWTCIQSVFIMLVLMEVLYVGLSLIFLLNVWIAMVFVSM